MQRSKSVLGLNTFCKSRKDLETYFGTIIQYKMLNIIFSGYSVECDEVCVEYGGWSTGGVIQVNADLGVSTASTIGRRLFLKDPPIFIAV